MRWMGIIFVILISVVRYNGLARVSEHRVGMSQGLNYGLGKREREKEREWERGR